MSVETLLHRKDFETQKNCDYEAIALSLSRVVSEISTLSQTEQPPVHLIGSLGRHIATSGACDWTEYSTMIQCNPKFAPRKTSDNVWELDIVVPEKLIPWQIFADVARDISRQDASIEVDPHLFRLDPKTNILTRGTRSTANPNAQVPIKTYSFEVNKYLPKILILDRWSQLLLYLSAGNLRKKDIPEIRLVLESMIIHDDFSDRERANEAAVVIGQNKKLFSARNITLLPYRLATSLEFRQKIYQFRKELINKDRTQPNSNQKKHHYQNLEPIYF